MTQMLAKNSQSKVFGRHITAFVSTLALSHCEVLGAQIEGTRSKFQTNGSPKIE